MSTDRDTTRIVRSWLRSDEHESADRVLDAVLDALDTTPQRRATWWPARRLIEMNTMMKLSLAAAAVILAALLGYNYLVAPNVGGPRLGDPTPSPSPTPTPTPTPAALNEQRGALEPGSYAIGDVIPERIVFTVPAGWEQLVVPATIWSAEGSNANLGFANVENLVTDPCDLGLGLQDPAVGSSVDDLATALAQLPGIEASAPTDVTMGGFPGKQMELTGLVECRGDSGLWECCGGTEFVPAPSPGERRQLWLLDVNGRRLVIASNVRPAASQATVDELQSIIDSIRFESP